MSVLNGFLSGIKILDLSHYLPGPIASLLLADLGADVIKVVPPSGDGMKALGPRDEAGTPLFHDALNAGKRELVLDLKAASDNAVLQRLVQSADVLIEGFRPGTLARLGFDPSVLRLRNKGLVICSISGYGSKGPLAQAAGHDMNFLAASGIMERNAHGLIDPPIADSTAALFAGLTILAALYNRSKTGEGCTIDIGLADMLMPLQLFHVAAFGRIGWMPKPNTYYLNGGLACYHDYSLADGRRMFLGALEIKFWRAFCTAAHRPDWVSRHGDPEPQAELIDEVSHYFASMSLEECRSRFRDVDCCLTAVLNVDEAVHSPYVVARDLVRNAASSLQVLFPAYVDGLPPTIRPPLRTITSSEAESTFIASQANAG